MYCRICGNEENVTLRTGRRGLLCDSCAADTPAKVSREAFDAAYWDKGDEVHHATRREFYDDYRASNITLGARTREELSAKLRERGIPHSPAQYDSAGNCLTCGEADRCPGVHTFEEIQAAARGARL